jgi:hypothetical protein
MSEAEPKKPEGEKLLKFYIPGELIEEYWQRYDEAVRSPLALYRLWKWLEQYFPEVGFGAWGPGGTFLHPFLQQTSRDTP